MAFTHYIRALIISIFILSTAARHAPPHRVHQHKHEAIRIGKRQSPSPPAPSAPAEASALTTADPTVLTYITPSPSAEPVAVTEQSQIVPSFVPQFTLCELPPIAEYSVSPILASSRPYSTAIYKNVSVSIPSGTGTCTTIYSPTITMVCATTLTGLFDMYTVTQCAQDLTFSTEYGYVLVTPTPTPLLASSNSSAVIPSSSSMTIKLSSSKSSPATSITSSSASSVQSSLLVDTAENTLVTPSPSLLPRQDASILPIPATITPGRSIETLTTYYMAPWQDLTAGTMPEDVDLKVCRTFAQNDTTECIREYQVWSTSLVTMTATSVTSINISTTIHGMSQLLVEHFVANVTEMLTTFSMSTTMDLEFQTEWTTTHSETRSLAISTGPTVFETLTVAYASSTPAPAASGSEDMTSTTTIKMTSTIYGGTSTVTIPAASILPASAAVATEASESVNFSSMLGIGGR